MTSDLTSEAEHSKNGHRKAGRNNRPAAEPATAGSAALTRASDISTKQIAWLYHKRLALGKINLIAGEPGTNKSTLTVDIAARVSTGRDWPDGTSCPLGSVIMIGAEDDAADTTVPRLHAAHADTDRIHFLDGTFMPDDKGGRRIKGFALEHLRTLENAINQIGDCKLLVIDPVSAYLAHSDSHKNAEIRGLLEPLSKLVAQYGVCCLMVTHLTKAVGGKAMHRSMGSLAFVAAARSAWLVVKDAEHPTRRLFLPVKNNLGNDITGFAFTVESSPDEVPYIAWEAAPVQMTADQALLASERVDAESEREAPARDAAIEWLLELLKNGPVAADEIKTQANESGMSWATLRRAKDTLGIKPRKAQFNGPWHWALPPSALANPSCSPVSTLSTMNTLSNMSTLGMEGQK